MLEIKKLTQKYRFGVPAFSNLSFSIPTGDLLCVLGKEESGKSSLLKTICGINRPESGKILLDGVDITETSIRDRDFFLQQEDLGFFRHKTLYDNLAYPLRIRKEEEENIRVKIYDLAKKYDFEDFILKKINKIEQDTLIIAAVARAELRSSKVYLFDHPFRDASNGQRMFQLFLPLFQNLRQNAHVLYATDNVSEAETLRSATLLLDYGYAQGLGTPTELKNNPISRFAYAFLHDTYTEEQGKIMQEGNEIFLQTETHRYPLLKDGLLHEIFIGKEVIVCSDSSDKKIYDLASEKLIYFKKID